MPAFKSLRKKLRRRRIEAMLLAGYAFAITCALLISLINKNTSSEPELPIYHASDDNFDFGPDVLTPAFSDSSSDNPFELVYMQVNDIKLLSDNDMVLQKLQDARTATGVIMPVDAKPKYREYGELSGIYQREKRVLVVKQGDTFIGLLTGLGMDTSAATEAYNVLRKVYDARSLKVGQPIELTATFDIQSRMLETLDKLVIQPERGSKYILRMNEYDKYEAVAEHEKFARDVRVAEGKVKGAASVSMMNAGVPRGIANEVIAQMRHMINFGRDIHNGDSFTVKYEVSKAADGTVVKTGGLLYASFVSGNRAYKIYRYNDSFYDERGQSRKTGLDIKPLAMRNARISSLFGYRRHPIYKTMKFHSGVDYAAPRGTQIFASGNGTVEMARYVNGYGNYIKIRHNAQYETAYGHMQGYARGIRPGVRVKKGQVIGYVGSTGRSTGPHLHFEILRNGQRINPLKAKVATGNDLYGGRLSEFRKRMRQIDASVERIGKTEVQKSEEKALGRTADILMDKIQEKNSVNSEGNSNTEAQAKASYSADKNISAAEAVTGSVSSAAETAEKSAAEKQSVSDTAPKENETAAVTESEPAEQKQAKAEESKTETAKTETKPAPAEKTDEEPKISYNGKIVYPPVPAGRARYNRAAAANRKIRGIRVPSAKPVYARR